MNFIKFIRGIYYILRRCNIPKTLYINFKKFPIKTAMHLPIYVYGKTIFRSLSGNIIINGKIHTGMVKIGKNDYYVKTAIPLTNWIINGTLRFNGPFKFLNGGYLCISKNGHLELGCNGFIGTDYKIMCFDKICIGDTLSATYNIQIYDTSYHYIQPDSGIIERLTMPIIIGDQVWIGNNTTISKGAKIPNESIIASNSLVNKDFCTKERTSGIFIAGCPAKIKKNGIRRIFDEDIETKLDSEFGYDRTNL